jgi:hypothetical protein
LKKKLYDKKTLLEKKGMIVTPFSKKENNFKQKKNNYQQKCSNESELRN